MWSANGLDVFWITPTHLPKEERCNVDRRTVGDKYQKTAPGAEAEHDAVVFEVVCRGRVA